MRKKRRKRIDDDDDDDDGMDQGQLTIADDPYDEFPLHCDGGRTTHDHTTTTTTTTGEELLPIKESITPSSSSSSSSSSSTTAMMPSFLQGLAKRIMHAGRLLQLLRLCNAQDYYRCCSGDSTHNEKELLEKVARKREERENQTRAAHRSVLIVEATAAIIVVRLLVVIVVVTISPLLFPVRRRLDVARAEREAIAKLEALFQQHLKQTMKDKRRRIGGGGSSVVAGREGVARAVKEASEEVLREGGILPGMVEADPQQVSAVQPHMVIPPPPGDCSLLYLLSCRWPTPRKPSLPNTRGSSDRLSCGHCRRCGGRSGYYGGKGWGVCMRGRGGLGRRKWRRVLVVRVALLLLLLLGVVALPGLPPMGRLGQKQHLHLLLLPLHFPMEMM